MGEDGEKGNPPPEEPINSEVLRLRSILSEDMNDEAILDVALGLSAPDAADTNNQLFRDNPALWRAFALLELLRVIPNPQELKQYQDYVFSHSDFDTSLEKLVEIETIKDASNEISITVTWAYLAVSGVNDDEKSEIIRAASKSIVNNANTNVMRAVEALRATGSIDMRQMHHIAILLGYAISQAQLNET